MHAVMCKTAREMNDGLSSHAIFRESAGISSGDIQHVNRNYLSEIIFISFVLFSIG